MDPDPGVERGTVGPLPLDVALDGDKRVPLLQNRAQRHDDAVHAVTARNRAHASDHVAAEPPALIAPRDLDCQTRERPPPARSVRIEPPLHDLVDAHREAPRVPSQSQGIEWPWARTSSVSGS